MSNNTNDSDISMQEQDDINMRENQNSKQRDESDTENAAAQRTQSNNTEPTGTESEEHETPQNQSAERRLLQYSNAMARYLVAEARPPHERPPWQLEDENDIIPFTAVQVLDEHPFAHRENLVFLFSADLYFDTEILNALLERRYVNPEAITGCSRSVGEIISLNERGIHLFGIVIKKHIDDKALRPDIVRCLKTLKILVAKFNVTSLGIIRDPALLTPNEWNYFLEQFNRVFSRTPISVVFFKNNLPVPRVEDRYRLIKEFHESSISGHKGITKTYAKLAGEYYWRNMQEDVRMFVRGCKECQTTKIVRVKTKQPMLITDTPPKPFSKLSLDYFGPLSETKAGNVYILSIQDNFSKYVILTPVARATAQEVARVFTEKVICYFGPPITIITDQGTHFMNKMLEEFAKIFRINKFCTTAYHPQSNGGIERMHHTLKEYLKLYTTENAEWDTWVSLCQHAFNTSEHEGLGYSPHEILFGERARTPSSFPPREELMTYDEYLANATSSLCQLRTLAAMNLVQSKCRSKEYYDRRVNAKHFREGEMVYLLKEEKSGKLDKIEYIGPCEIIEVDYINQNVRIQKGNKSKIVNINRIKRSHELALRTGPIPEDEQENPDL